MYYCTHCYYSSPYLHNVQRHEKYPENIQRAEKEGKIIILHPCTFCNYKSDGIYNQCTQEAGTQTVSSNEKEEHTFTKRGGFKS